MTRILLLILIGAATFFLLLLAANPDLLEDVWLYIIGLAGAVVKLFQVLASKIKNFTQEVKNRVKENSTKAVG
jgi:hypothetical protein